MESIFFIYDLGVSIRNFDRFLTCTMFYFSQRATKRMFMKARRIFSSIICSEIPPRTSYCTSFFFFYSHLSYMSSTYRARTLALALIEIQSYVYFCSKIAVIHNYTWENTTRYWPLSLYLDNNLLQIRHDWNKYRT